MDIPLDSDQAIRTRTDQAGQANLTPDSGTTTVHLGQVQESPEQIADARESQAEKRPGPIREYIARRSNDLVAVYDAVGDAAGSGSQDQKKALESMVPKLSPN